MATPKLNEELIVAMLEVPAAVDSISNLCTGAVLSLIDVYDRKVVREPFMDVLNAATSLHWFLGRLAIIASMTEMHKADALTVDKLDDAATELTRQANLMREVLVKAVKLASQCPLDTDKVH